MENIEDLLPKDKFDNSNIDKLKLLTDDEIRPVCPRLLEWLQDYNWPVTKDVIPVLAAHQTIIVPLIMEILLPEEEDDDWKYWIIVCLLPVLDDINLEAVLPVVKRIADSPTKWEQMAETDQAAREFLTKKFMFH